MGSETRTFNQDLQPGPENPAPPEHFSPGDPGDLWEPGKIKSPGTPFLEVHLAMAIAIHSFSIPIEYCNRLYDPM